ncbi:MAG TPA: hypothetical protein PKH77_04970 [Anaerolineae bacterium]|nr:hypothetical protein [Anaerolineae bacterium]
MKIYKYNDYEYKDEAGEFTTEEVKRQLTQYFPEIANCTVEEKKSGEDTVVTFVKRAGTKGREGEGERGSGGDLLSDLHAAGELPIQDGDDDPA